MTAGLQVIRGLTVVGQQNDLLTTAASARLTASVISPTRSRGPDPNTSFDVVGTLYLDGRSGDHDLSYDSKSFQGNPGGDQYTAVVAITGGAYNIAFTNCIIGANGNAVGNGVLIQNWDYNLHHVSFDHCHFESQPRMGFECIDRSTTGTNGYTYVDITNCTFATQGAETISYDDSHGYSGYCTVDNNEILGGGRNCTDPANGDELYSWGQTFEINNTHNLTVTNNDFYPGATTCLNLRTASGSGAAYWDFSGNTVHCDEFEGGINYLASAEPTTLSNVTSQFAIDDTWLMGSPYSSATWGWLTACTNIDFSPTTLSGCAAAYGDGGGNSGITQPTVV